MNKLEKSFTDREQLIQHVAKSARGCRRRRRVRLKVVIDSRWTRTRSPARTRRDEARYHNRIIDRALLQPTMQHREDVLSSAKQRDAPRLAERIRRRATWLARHDRPQAQQLLTHRDELIMAVYADLAAEGWASAWCDGSSTGRASERHAGIGAVLMDASGNCLSRLSR